MSTAKRVEARIREVCFEDHPGIESLMEQAGLSRYPHDIWVHRWKENPTIRENSTPLSQGWILESGGAIVGYLGSIPHSCRFGQKILVAAATTAFGVLSRFRKYSLALSIEFLRQRGVDLLLNTTANAQAARIFQYLEFRPIPQQGYGSALYITISPTKLVDAYLKRAGFSGVLPQLAGTISGMALSVYQLLRGRPFRNLEERKFEVVSPDEINEGFDALWERKKRERQVLLPERSREWLRWHFFLPDGGGNISVVCACEGERLIGYAVVRKEQVAETGLVRSRILDLVAEEDRPSIIDRLLGGCYLTAATDGSDFLEMVGFPGFVRERFLRQGAKSRRFPCCPYFYLAKDPILAKALERPSSWYGCPYDGDAGL